MLSYDAAFIQTPSTGIYFPFLIFIQFYSQNNILIILFMCLSIKQENRHHNSILFYKPELTTKVEETQTASTKMFILKIDLQNNKNTENV